MTGEHDRTCDWPGCHDPATRITRHERRNTGTVTAYWCDRHFAEATGGD